MNVWRGVACPFNVGAYPPQRWILLGSKVTGGMFHFGTCHCQTIIHGGRKESELKNLGVPRTAKMLERKISTRNMRRENESALASYELKQAMREIARLNGALDLAKAEIADLRHRMSASFGAMEMAEKLAGVFAKHDYKDGGGVGHYFVHQKEH